MTSTVVYSGELRTVSTHLQSGVSIISDAPIDNNGKGEAFSPTDAVANAVATCMMTIMGIKAREMQVNIENSTAQVTKIMQQDPRRIGKIVVAFQMQGVGDSKTQTILERVAMTCPVFLSLHPDIEKAIDFCWA